ncbi:Serine/Threonine-Protein Kinase Plk4, partial [Manis pentadactyla]
AVDEGVKRGREDGVEDGELLILLRVVVALGQKVLEDGSPIEQKHHSQLRRASRRGFPEPQARALAQHSEQYASLGGQNGWDEREEKSHPTDKNTLFILGSVSTDQFQ